MVSWELLMETLWNFVIKIIIYNKLYSIYHRDIPFQLYVPSVTFLHLIKIRHSHRQWCDRTNWGLWHDRFHAPFTGGKGTVHARASNPHTQSTAFFYSTLRVLGQLFRLSTAACLDARTLEVNRTTSVDTPPFQTLAPFGDADAALARSPVLWHQLTVRWVERETTYLFSQKKTDSVDSSLFPVPC